MIDFDERPFTCIHCDSRIVIQERPFHGTKCDHNLILHCCDQLNGLLKLAIFIVGNYLFTFSSYYFYQLWEWRKSIHLTILDHLDFMQLIYTCTIFFFSKISRRRSIMLDHKCWSKLCPSSYPLSPLWVFKSLLYQNTKLDEVYSRSVLAVPSCT